MIFPRPNCARGAIHHALGLIRNFRSAICYPVSLLGGLIQNIKRGF
jgi:hypothetical protein